MGSDETVSPQVLAERVRGLMIDYLELVASFEAQGNYDRDAPIINVAYEVINQWQDNVLRNPAVEHPGRWYTDAEVDALTRFHEAWDAAADAVPDDHPPIAQVQAIPSWQHLRDVAQQAVATFRGQDRTPPTS